MDGAEKLCFNKVLSQLTHIEEICGGGITETVTGIFKVGDSIPYTIYMSDATFENLGSLIEINMSDSPDESQYTCKFRKNSIFLCVYDTADGQQLKTIGDVFSDKDIKTGTSVRSTICSVYIPMGDFEMTSSY